MVDIYLNKQLVELSNDNDLTYTLQVNDISDISTRQTSYTNSFKLPKTNNNTEILRGLGLVGDISNIPYQKMNVDVLDNGFPLIYNGWGIIKETTEYYSLHVYSGLIDFFKAIENKNIGTSLELTEINHNKNVQTVIDTFNNDFEYSYLLADYNGLTHYDIDKKINIDYLPPSVKVGYLWNKIFETFGYTYSGAIFSNDRFTNLFLTYPKGVSETTTAPVLLYDRANGGLVANSGLVENLLPSNYLGYHTFTATEDMFFKPTLFDETVFFQFLGGVQKKIIVYINGIDFGEFNNNVYDLKIGDLIELRLRLNVFDFNKYRYGKFGFQTISKVETAQNFNEELKDLSINDFVKDVLNMFSLTMFTNQNNKHIEFLTIQERTETAQITDWTSKYVNRKSETYIFDSYAQKNNFKYNYNDKESSHFDSAISINNVNLKDSTDTFKSFTYAPELKTDGYAVGTTSVFSPLFKQYDKETTENNGVSSIKYKPLSKRYYYQRKETLTQNCTIGSRILNSSLPTTKVNLANFNQLDMNSIVGLNYNSMQLILNDSRLHKIDLALSMMDVINLDFKRLYYFEQEQQYYFLNRLSFKNNSFSGGEFVRVKKQIPFIAPPTFFINVTSVVVNNCDITVNYETNYPLGTNLNLVLNPNTFGIQNINIYDADYFKNEVLTTTGALNTFTFNVVNGYDYLLQIDFNNDVFSSEFVFNNRNSCTYTPAFLNIISAKRIPNTLFKRGIEVVYETDATGVYDIFVIRKLDFETNYRDYLIGTQTDTNKFTRLYDQYTNDIESIKIKIGNRESLPFTNIT